MSIAAVPVSMVSIAESRSGPGDKKRPRNRLVVAKPDEWIAPEAR